MIGVLSDMMLRECTRWQVELSRKPVRVKMDAFLAEIKLGQHAAILDKLGYDDPNDFAEFEASDLEKLETRCVSEGMPPAHVDKLVHRIAPGHHLGVHHVACM